MDISTNLQQQIDNINIQINTLDATRDHLLQNLQDLQEQLSFVTKILKDDQVKQKFKTLLESTENNSPQNL